MFEVPMTQAFFPPFNISARDLYLLALMPLHISQLKHDHTFLT
jgi:hypothetical protein